MSRIFDAASVTDLQSCQRRFVLSSSWRPLRWHPKQLFDAVLRRSVLHISQGKPVEEVRVTARSQYLQSAANPGLDVPNPYPVAQEYVALLNSIITSLPRMEVPPKLQEGRLVSLDSVSWRISSFTDLSGSLHRWLTVDRWDEARQRRELHSWWVAGDMAVVNTSMTLHIIEIGQMRNGQLSNPWIRGYRHPSLPNVKRVRFRLDTRGKTFRGWTPVRLVDHPNADVDDWVDWLWEDGAAQEHNHTIQVATPGQGKSSACLTDLLREFARAARISPVWRELPMSRGACDWGYPCPFQPVCYEDADPEASGLFVPREALKSPQTASSPPSAKA